MKSKFASIGNPLRNRFPRPGIKVLLGLSLLVGLIALAGCSQGSYPLDIFYEMHYQPSYKAHEPPRLSVPESAVAWFPPPQATSFANDGEHLYQVNCSMCHGPAAKGDGPVLKKMIQQYGYRPALDPDLTSPQVMAMGPEGIEAFMRSGVVVMPSFSKLLTDDEMRLVAEYVVNCLQGKQPQACP
ncbi:MAG: cytochrome c [Chloroflexi bacterium]|nr:cytochrome c [Chloroflexota bacterium]